jgi:hypothetical protein
LSPEYKARLVGLLREVVEVYKSCGQRHARLTEEELDHEFLSLFRAYAGDRHNRGLCRALNDIAAENILRRRAQPIKKVAAEMVDTCMPARIDDAVKDPPVVLLAFGHVLWSPAIGNVLGLDAWEAEQDLNQTEFRWFLGLSEKRSERVVNLDDARARRTSG